ncbi:nucleoside hydrolase [Ruania zhangjianzhongii]|uniref:nucleoside hydrolase n=1 Tax=Ruania zhangjianzhongii TaxID=2603206 RepID=UPI001F3E6365|nr:nucleoside hydrolase [Ruania zhangjianzhongii]
MRTPIILDVDTGIDDALALMFAARHPDLELRAVTCVSGNTSLTNVVANTCAVLDLVGAENLPLAAGAERPLIERPRDAASVHGADGLGNLGLPPSDRPVEHRHAVEVLREVLTEADEPVTIVALAPLTNLALLLRMYPAVAERIARVVFMGGSASVGNASPVAEFNIWHDPEAAAVVINSGLPLTMYGLDVFHQVVVEPGEVARLADSVDVVARAVGHLLGFQAQSEEPALRLIGDAGAVCALVAPELMRIERWPVRVELTGLSRGQTVVDRRTRAGEDRVHGTPGVWPELDVVLGADGPAVVELFLETLGCRG